MSSAAAAAAAGSNGGGGLPRAQSRGSQKHRHRWDDEELCPRRRRRVEEPRRRRREESEEQHFNGRAGDLVGGQYEILKEAGVGTFGRVLECFDRRRSERVAIKVIRKIARYRESALVEAEVLRDVAERNCRLCVRLLKTFDYRGHFCLVFESLGRSLYDRLKANGYKPFERGAVATIASQLLRALAFLHDMRLVHTDLKLENVLFRGDEATNTVVVIDFGGATYDDERRKSTIINTRQYRAPEVILNIGWSTPSDIWSAGCVVAELSQGDLLFATHSNTEHIGLIEKCVGLFPRHILERSRYFKKYFDVETGKSTWSDNLGREGREHVRKMPTLETVCRDDHQLRQLLRGLLVIDPDKRLTAREALEKCDMFIHNKYFRENRRDDDDDARRRV